MGDYQLVSPSGEHVAELIYETEPPHGDSLHRLILDGRRFPGRVWGRYFTCSTDGDRFGFSWAPAGFESRSVVVDLPARRFAILGLYMAHFLIAGNDVVGQGANEGFRQSLTTPDFAQCC